MDQDRAVHNASAGDDQKVEADMNCGGPVITRGNSGGDDLDAGARERASRARRDEAYTEDMSVRAAEDRSRELGGARQPQT